MLKQFADAKVKTKGENKMEMEQAIKEAGIKVDVRVEKFNKMNNVDVSKVIHKHLMSGYMIQHSDLRVTDDGLLVGVYVFVRERGPASDMFALLANQHLGLEPKMREPELDRDDEADED